MRKGDVLLHQPAAGLLIGSKGKCFALPCEVVGMGLDDRWQEMTDALSKRE